MKMKIFLIITIAVIFSFSACSTIDEKESVGSVFFEESVSSESEITEESKKTEESKVEETKNLSTVKVPTKDIYIDYDSSLREDDEIYSILMYKNYDSLVGLAYNYDVEFTGTLEDVIDVFKGAFIYDASLKSRGDLLNCEIVVESSEKVTIADRESICFIGSVLNNKNWQCHVYGYTFIIDGVPCAVIGLVSAQAQDAEMIAETDALVDEIASTIRTTK